ncbi:hypothetical protein [Brevibacillus laterosporus]|uniref:hypothetical protein n=1 Tax=Brevibacillus laterosporus TaxID=1465 RepID=UPI000B9A5FBA|nr:hypothetical protein [Brevibacillus laterosporus]
MKIKLNYTLTDQDHLTETSHHERIMELDYTREYIISCYEGNACIKGGFDLTEVIRKMIKNSETQIKGTLICKGLLRKHTKNRCLRKLDYSIELIIE